MRRAFLSVVFAAFGAAAALAQGAYYLRSVDYEVRGRSLPYFLGLAAELEEGREFKDRAALDAYLARARQLLLNERVLEAAEIEPRVGPAEADGRVPVDLTVRVKDTWNIIALPYFKYDSNDGLLLSVRGRDYNFLGTMEALRLDLNYEYEDERSSIGAELKFSYPFPALGLDWSLDLGAAIESDGVRPDPTLSVELELVTEMKLGRGILDLGLGQSMAYNGLDDDEVPYGDSLYYVTGLEAGWSYPLWIDELGQRLDLRTYLGSSANWAWGGLRDEELKDTPSAYVGLELDYGVVNWMGNFRDGWKAKFGVEPSYSLSSSGVAAEAEAEAVYFKSFGWAGIGARFLAFSSTETTDKAGKELRGILNKRAETHTAWVLNLEAPLRVVNFTPSRWFDKSWMRLFDFEQQWSPFLDISQGYYDDTWFLVTKGWYGAGLEVITYPAIMRSFYIRISVGWDLVELLSTRSLSGRSSRDGYEIREIFFGLGHHF